jgi:hypothetical protein
VRNPTNRSSTVLWVGWSTIFRTVPRNFSKFLNTSPKFRNFIAILVVGPVVSFSDSVSDLQILFSDSFMDFDLMIKGLTRKFSLECVLLRKTPSSILETVRQEKNLAVVEYRYRSR